MSELPRQSATHARNEGPGGCVPWETYELAATVINRLVEHLDKAMPLRVVSTPDGEPHDIHDWLMFHCFSDDHELYDDIMALPGTKKTWQR